MGGVFTLAIATVCWVSHSVSCFGGVVGASRSITRMMWCFGVEETKKTNSSAN